MTCCRSTSPKPLPPPNRAGIITTDPRAVHRSGRQCAWKIALTEQAQIISFNWDLVLDELLFSDSLCKQNYGFGSRAGEPRLLKPHGSLNWYEQSTGQHLKQDKKFLLAGKDSDAVYAFKPYRAPSSSRREYMPLIVPPVYNKEFSGVHFRRLWREAVAVLSTASEVRFLGYSLANADFHARFILRCGFYNQEHGEILKTGKRKPATGRSLITVVDPNKEVLKRIEDAAGWPCTFVNGTIEEWVEAWPA